MEVCEQMTEIKHWVPAEDHNRVLNEITADRDNWRDMADERGAYIKAATAERDTWMAMAGDNMVALKAMTTERDKWLATASSLTAERDRAYQPGGEEVNASVERELNDAKRLNLAYSIEMASVQGRLDTERSKCSDYKEIATARKLQLNQMTVSRDELSAQHMAFADMLRGAGFMGYAETVIDGLRRLIAANANGRLVCQWRGLAFTVQAQRQALAPIYETTYLAGDKPMADIEIKIMEFATMGMESGKHYSIEVREIE